MAYIKRNDLSVMLIIVFKKRYTYYSQEFVLMILILDIFLSPIEETSQQRALYSCNIQYFRV